MYSTVLQPAACTSCHCLWSFLLFLMSRSTDSLPPSLKDVLAGASGHLLPLVVNTADDSSSQPDVPSTPLHSPEGQRSLLVADPEAHRFICASWRHDTSPTPRAFIERATSGVGSPPPQFLRRHNTHCLVHL